jgi:hypothetical protein
MRVNDNARVRVCVVFDGEERLDEVFDIFAFAKDNSKRMTTRIPLKLA